MIEKNQADEAELYDQVMHETLTTLTVINARIQLLRKRVETRGMGDAARLPSVLRDLETLIAERAGNLHRLAAKLPPKRIKAHARNQ